MKGAVDRFWALICSVRSIPVSVLIITIKHKLLSDKVYCYHSYYNNYNLDDSGSIIKAWGPQFGLYPK